MITRRHICYFLALYTVVIMRGLVAWERVFVINAIAIMVWTIVSGVNENAAELKSI